tara:strand:+ start:297 stop:1268 length:972 start_codon:yes stop_codon:yes gene_type:complete
MRLVAKAEKWKLAEVFKISRGSRTETELVTVTLYDGTFEGRGECMANHRYNETQESVLACINKVDIDDQINRQKLQTLLPACAARNAIDCALWDLEAKRAGKRVTELVGIDKSTTLITAFTISADTPDKMAAAAHRNSERPLLKLKISGDCDVDRVKAVRYGAPNARLIVDANEAWTEDMVEPLSKQLKALGVEMIEQPLPKDADRALANIPHTIPFCADESCHTTQDLENLLGLYDVVNIKLDKAGGLTEAIRLKRNAMAKGFKIMVGCMISTSLAMAPAYIVAHGAEYVDIDGPLLLAEDRTHGLEFSGSLVSPPSELLWG